LTQSDRNALVVLSQKVYENVYLPRVKHESTNYSVHVEANGVKVVLRHGMDPETARRIDQDGRCACDFRVCFQAQCVHEFCADGDFIAEKWDTRHYQSFALPVASIAASSSSTSDDGAVWVDNGAAVSATRLSEVVQRTSNALSPRELSRRNGESHEDPSYADDTDDWDFTTTDSGFEHGEGNDDGEDGIDSQVAEIDRAKIMKLCQEVAEAVCDSEKSRRATLVGGLFNILNQARGINALQLFDTGEAVVTSKPAARVAPIPARAPRRGATGTTPRAGLATQILTGKPRGGNGCGFCGKKDGHNLTRCPMKRPHGKHLKGEALKELMVKLHNNVIITPLPGRLLSAGLVRISLPTSAKWLVLKGHFIVNPDRLHTDIENQVALVTMLDGSGNILKDLEDVLVEQRVVFSWMSAKASSAATSAKNEAKFSKVFLAIPDNFGGH
jgi:hypothetical protein